MGVLGEFLIISMAAAAGVFIAAIPGFPFPGSVTGMIIMLILLSTKLLKLEQIVHASDFFIRFLPLFFIPLIVNLLKETTILEDYGFELFIVIILTTVITLAATGLTAKLMLSLKYKKDNTDV